MNDYYPFLDHRIDNLRKELQQLKDEIQQLKNEFRQFLEYSKVKLSYEMVPDNSEPTLHIKTILKFKAAND